MVSIVFIRADQSIHQDHSFSFASLIQCFPEMPAVFGQLSAFKSFASEYKIFEERDEVMLTAGSTCMNFRTPRSVWIRSSRQFIFTTEPEFIMKSVILSLLILVFFILISAFFIFKKVILLQRESENAANTEREEYLIEARINKK